MQNIIITGAKGRLSCKASDWLKSKDCFEVSQISLRTSAFESIDFSKTDCIVHIAGVTPENAKDESDYDNINYLLTKRLADKAKSAGVKQFIYISSMAVYGISQGINKPECGISADTPLMPESEYGKSKLNAEEYLRSIESVNFAVCLIRVPSIFDKEKTEYIDQYKYLADKLPVIPKAFTNNYKSFIHSDDLFELIYLIIESRYSGIICPDSGAFSAFCICSFIYPEKPVSRMLGKLLEVFMKHNSRIIDYYGAIYYKRELSNAFDGKYRVTNIKDEIKELYE